MSGVSYLVCHNVVHLRAKPDNGSERVSQLRMGQSVQALAEENGWLHVEGEDTYRGWADKRWLAEPTDQPLTSISTVFADLRAEPAPTAPLLLRLPMLARVQLDARCAEGGARRDGWLHAMVPDGSLCGWLRETSVALLPTVAAGQRAARAAAISREFLGTPYLWGGSSSYGLDCSGFVQYCFEIAGVLLRRDADIQRSDARFIPVEKENLQPGDLVFFGKPDRITHVGIQFDGNTFIHAAGGAGVIVTDWGDSRYSPSFVDARRLDPAKADEPITRFEADER